MANYWHGVVVAGLFALVGCQGNKQVAMVDPLPPPNFKGPTLTPAAPPPAPVAVAAEPRPQMVIPPVRSVAPAAVPAGIPRDWVPVASANQWNWIVIHHSATPTGGAAKFGREHQAKGWDELGYHFVIGNGSDTGNGQVEVGTRWPKQKWGAHAKTADEQYNQHGIGICLVGNFDVTRPTDAQMKSLAKLVAYLMKTYHVPPGNIIGHGATKATDCPGRNLSVAAVRRLGTQQLAAGDIAPDPKRTASAGGELLTAAGVR